MPLALDTRFSKAAAGLKNMCENLDHGTAAEEHRGGDDVEPEAAAPTAAAACSHAQIRPSVTLASSDRMNRSAAPGGTASCLPRRRRRG